MSRERRQGHRETWVMISVIRAARVLQHAGGDMILMSRGIAAIPGIDALPCGPYGKLRGLGPEGLG